MSIAKAADKTIGRVVNLVTSSVSQTSTKKNKQKYDKIEGLDALCRQAAAESFVLLKNDGAVLPLTPGNTVSLFGRVQYDTFFVGYGSGGDVNAHYKVSFIEGMRACEKITLNEELAAIYKKWVKENPADNGYWGHWPMCHEEMHVNEALAMRAAKISDTAVVFIGRAAGEDRENTLTKGSFYLTDEEENMLWCVRRYFKRTAVILNIGNIIDFSWVEKYDIPCVGICWQGGMETGNALADILCGDVNPCGHLTDTVAKRYEQYPSASNFGGKKKNHYEEDIYVGYRYFETFMKDAALFPFGHGLSYTEFETKTQNFSADADLISFETTVKNTGKTAGKATVQIYFDVENAVLPVPAIQLAAFKKTSLLEPDAEETLEFIIPKNTFACFDDAGISGYRNAWILSEGAYRILAGFSVRNNEEIGGFEQPNTILIEQTREAGAPKMSERLMRLRPAEGRFGVFRNYEPAPTAQTFLREDILAALPETTEPNEDRSASLFDVADGTVSLERFAASLTNTELEALTRGDYIMNSPLGPTGNAGVFGGVLESLRERQVLPVTTTDGPSGIRLAATSALLPSGTALACAYNPELVQALYALLGEEMRDRKSDVLLAPGMNIHRDPLCGRNFEYFSEDPLVSGVTAAAVVKGLADGGVNACPKHFACNNQETNRTKNDSVLSQRALREIYLRGFEICVKTAHPQVLMTSYNKINGVWGHYNYELVTKILRCEWGYKGLVITDWWMQKSASPEFPAMRNQAYRVRAGVDVLMPGGERMGKKVPDGTLLETLGTKDGITRGELQNTAMRVLRFVMQTNKFLNLWRQETMKAMSFNVLCYGNGENEWTKRIPLVVRTIRNEDPDAFGVQEAHYDWMKALIGAFPDYAYVGKGRDDGRKKGEFSAVFYKKDKYKKLDEGHFWLSETPEKAGSKGWDAACIRICSWAKLEERETGKQFVFMNTHLDHVGKVAMQKGAELIAARAAEIAPDLPVILTGDFNITPDSAPCAAVKAGGFADCRDIAKRTDLNCTYHGFTSGTEGISVIDYVFVKGDIKVKSFRVNNKKLDAHFPSDHFPVIAELAF